MDLPFVKMHGIGNDFVLVEDLDERWDFTPEAIEWLCDRHFGIGADGMLVVRPATLPEADFRMRYYNADGYEAEMCGNGVRCFAKYLADRAFFEGDDVNIETGGGLKRIHVLRDETGVVERATVDMGVPKLAPSDIPTTLQGEVVQDRTLETALGEVRVTCVNMGNPHAVIWVGDVDRAPVEELGPLVETHEVFPQKTNVEFAQVVSEGLIRQRTWERGVGETLACGTGACATLVAATLSCKTGREATIELSGGELDIRWQEDGHVYMTGGATEVFSGAVRMEDEA